MTYCLNPDCQQPQNPDNAEYCLSCGTKLIALLRGRYRVLRMIGQGGFGRTYLAVDEDRLKTRCVIKQFSPQLQGSKSLEKAVRLFDQEAVRLHELGEHPQIPALLAYFEHDKRLYLVQQFVEGQTLQQEVAQYGVFEEQKIRAVLAGILPTLKYVHDHQVIHRDITPSNIIRRQFDHKLVLIDFGVAKLLSSENLAQPGTKIGTEGYAPIEQLRSGKAYPASDLYSLGTTCLYLMTRTKPDDLYDPLEGRWRWKERLIEQGGAVSLPIAQILDKLLKDLVSERYQSADAVMRDLRQALSRPVASTSGVGIGSAASLRPASPSRPPISPPARSPISNARPSGHLGVSGQSGTTTNAPRSQPVSSSQPRVSQPRSSSPPSQPPISGSQHRRSFQTLTGHSRWVMAVAISPDRQTIVSAGLDDTIKLWNIATGELLQTFTGHTKPVNSVIFNPNGQLLISASDDHTIRIWNAATGKLLRVLSGHTRDVNAVAIHADGELLASGGEDRTLRLWKLSTGESLHVFSGPSGMIRSIAISPDGQTVVSGGLDNQIKVWNVKTGEQIRTLLGHFNSVNAVVISPDCQTIVSGSKDKTIKVWDLSKGTLIRTLTGHSDAVNGLSISADGKLLLSGSSDKTIRLWNLKLGVLSATLSEHINSVNTVAMSSDGRIAASGGSDNTVRIWQIS